MARVLLKVLRMRSSPSVLCLVWVVASGCALGAPSYEEAFAPEPLWEEVAAQRVAASAELLARGSELFHQRCAGCHGPDGDGRGPAAHQLPVRPRDLTAGVFKFRSTRAGTMPADLDLFRTITAGFPQYGMPSYRWMSERDRWALVHHVKTLSDEWQDGEPGAPVSVPDEVERTDELLDRGRELFGALKCQDCHMGPGGGQPRQRDIRDDFGNPIQARNYLLGHLYFKGGGRPRDTARILLTGLPGTPMGSYATELDDPKDVWALSHFVHSLAVEAP